MQEIDNRSSTEKEDPMDDHELFMKEVIQDDHELMYLDTYLNEILSATSNSE